MGLKDDFERTEQSAKVNQDQSADVLAKALKSVDSLFVEMSEVLLDRGVPTATFAANGTTTVRVKAPKKSIFARQQYLDETRPTVVPLPGRGWPIAVSYQQGSGSGGGHRGALVLDDRGRIAFGTASYRYEWLVLDSEPQAASILAWDRRRHREDDCDVYYAADGVQGNNTDLCPHIKIVRVRGEASSEVRGPQVGQLEVPGWRRPGSYRDSFDQHPPLPEWMLAVLRCLTQGEVPSESTPLDWPGLTS